MRFGIKYRPRKQQRCAATIEDGFKGNWGCFPQQAKMGERIVRPFSENWQQVALLAETVIPKFPVSVVRPFCEQATDNKSSQVPKWYSRLVVPFVLHCVYTPNLFLPKVVISDLSTNPLQSDTFHHRLLRQAVFFLAKYIFPIPPMGEKMSVVR